FSSRISIREQAVSDHPGVAHLYLPSQWHGLLETSASQDPSFRDEHSLEFDVPATTLDALLSEPDLPPGSLVIKIDVEGLAPTLGVLRGAQQLITQRRPVMMVEYLEGPVDELNKLLSDWQYHDVVARPDGSIVALRGLHPFPDQPNHF